MLILFSSNVAAAFRPDAQPLMLLSNIQQSINNHKLVAGFGEIEKNNFKLYDSKLIHVRIENRGSEIARDARISYQGSGMAERMNGGIIQLRESPFMWTNSIPIGDVIPGGGVELLLWPHGFPIFSLPCRPKHRSGLFKWLGPLAFNA